MKIFQTLNNQMDEEYFKKLINLPVNELHEKKCYLECKLSVTNTFLSLRDEEGTYYRKRKKETIEENNDGEPTKKKYRRDENSLDILERNEILGMIRNEKQEEIRKEEEIRRLEKNLIVDDKFKEILENPLPDKLVDEITNGYAKTALAAFIYNALCHIGAFIKSLYPDIIVVVQDMKKIVKNCPQKRKNNTDDPINRQRALEKYFDKDKKDKKNWILKNEHISEVQIMIKGLIEKRNERLEMIRNEKQEEISKEKKRKEEEISKEEIGQDENRSPCFYMPESCDPLCIYQSHPWEDLVMESDTPDPQLNTPLYFQ